MKPLVAHFIDSSDFGGAEQAVLTVLSGLDASRWDLLLIHHPHDALAQLIEGAHDLGVPTLAVPVMDPGWAGVRRLPPFARELRRLSPAIVHLHLTWPLACQYALIAAGIARVPAVVATAHLYVDVSVNKRVMVQQRLLTRWVDRYIAVSNHVRTELVDHFGWPEAKFEIVPNAVELPAPTQPDPRRRAQLTGGKERPVVVVPARLAPQKGQRFLLQAATAVPEAVFLFAGDGPDRSALVALATELGIADRVTFLGHRRDVSDLLAEADLVVLPSLFEGLPLALLEAMAAGRAVVTTRIAGNDEVVSSGVDGVLVEPGDADALAVAIRRLLADPDEAQRLGAAARRTIRERFTIPPMAAHVEEVYTELVGR